MGLWDFIAFFFWSYVFISYLMILFAIVGDLFRDSDLGGGMKALWMIFLVFFPFLGALIYLITRGKGMAARQAAAMRTARAQTDEYIRTTARGTSVSEDIASAHALLTSGAITQAEFDTLKARALAGGGQPVGV